MYEEIVARIEDEHVGATVWQSLGAHLAPRDHGDGVAGVVDDVHEFVGGGHHSIPRLAFAGALQLSTPSSDCTRSANANRMRINSQAATSTCARSLPQPSCASTPAENTRLWPTAAPNRHSAGCRIAPTAPERLLPSPCPNRRDRRRADNW